jgi:uncharacterized membrane protein
MYLSGLLMEKFPPKDISAIYGYRTPKSMKNQRLWEEANRYSAIWIKRWTFLFLIISVVLSLLFTGFIITFLIMGLMMGFFVLLFAIVERRLKELEKE